MQVLVWCAGVGVAGSLLLGCCKPAPPSGAEPEAVEAVTQVMPTEATEAEEATDKPEPTETQTAIYKALSVREGAPGCVALGDMSEAPATDLVWLAENAKQPPWVSIRAGECVITSFMDEAALQRWVTEAAFQGLGWLVLDHLDTLPVEQAQALAVAAIEQGPEPEAAKKRVAKSTNPNIQVLANPQNDNDTTETLTPNP